jgi:hypothetical protein
MFHYKMAIIKCLIELLQGNCYHRYDDIDY